MSEVDLLDKLTELSILSKLRKEYRFTMAKFCYYGDIASLAGDQGLKITGNIGGGSINNHYYGFGAITSVVLSDYLMQLLDQEGAMPIPVGFDNVGASKCKGAIAKQFPDAIPAGLSAEQADAYVVKAYFDLPVKEQQVGDDFKVWNIPATPAKAIIKRSKRTMDIDWNALPQRFYVLVNGDAEELELVREICEDEGVPYHTAPQGVYMTNVDRGFYPPLAAQLYRHDFAKTCSKIQEIKPESPVKAENVAASSGVTAPVPEVWNVLQNVSTIPAYEEVISSNDFREYVSLNKRRLGTNKNKTTTKLLSTWNKGEAKTVRELLDMCAKYYESEAMQAKLFNALISHLEIEDDKLVRRQN